MNVNIQELLDSAGLGGEAFYPGKRLIKKYMPHGEHKSHCMVFDWNEGNLLRIELKAGSTGHTLSAKELHQYPVSFQARTYLEIDTTDGEEDDEGDAQRGKSGGGGKKPSKKNLTDVNVMSSAFSKMAEGAQSLSGEIKKFVVMGREIAKEGYAQALDNLKYQMAQSKILAMDLMKGVADIIKRATPGGGLAAKGDETIKYKYDAEKTSPMFGGLIPS